MTERKKKNKQQNNRTRKGECHVARSESNVASIVLQCNSFSDEKQNQSHQKEDKRTPKKKKKNLGQEGKERKRKDFKNGYVT